MNPNQRKIILLGALGLFLIVFAIKLSVELFAAADASPGSEARPLVLFFNEDEPCECMQDLTRRAEVQMVNWPEARRGGIPVLRLAFRQQRDLELKYKVFRAPCLVLLDAQDQVAWRQDYPLIEGGPFRLDELEAAIAEMGTK
ncbi:MAG: hypothetical protein AB1894_29760 [Chloroflexota bacterium]